MSIATVDVLTNMACIYIYQIQVNRQDTVSIVNICIRCIMVSCSTISYNIYL